MKTIKQVIQERPDFKKLINAVVRELGKESIQDVNNHGADAGYPGFTYYSDTHKFAMRHRKDIISLLNESADQLGEEVVSMIKNFGVFRRQPADNQDLQDIYKYLGGGRPEQGTITNVMAWFALEEVCRMFED
jgi:hypothetical protein